MAVAIKTKFIGPTNHRGSRVKASVMYNWGDGSRGSLTVNWDHSKNSEDNHAAAAEALAKLLEWDGEWHIADGGDFYVWVRVGSHSKRFTVS